MADDEQFSLCWNNFNSNLSAGFHESLQRGDLVDVTLAAEGQLVQAHRLVLSVCSPYFRKMFNQMPKNQHAFVFLKDVTHSALQDLIQFMYCGEVNVKQDALPAFISTAEALQIKGLTETGDSAPAQQSPVKEDPPAVPVATASISTTVPVTPQRTKVQRNRIQSYKLESEESGDDKIVHLQASTSHHVTAQQLQAQTSASSQKRAMPQRGVQSHASKRTKMSISASSDGLDTSDTVTTPTQAQTIQTVQIVKQLPAQVIEPEYIELPMESVNPKAEPDYTDEAAEIETVDAETEQEHKLSEHEQGDADDDGNYVEDETYGDMGMGKYEESYLTEGEEGAKPGVSGFVDSYTSDGGTGTEQSTQATASPRRQVAFSRIARSRVSEFKRPKLLETTNHPTGTTAAVSGDDEKQPGGHGEESYVDVTTVPGFKFPLQQRTDVERLEHAIQKSKDFRKRYVNFLIQRKPKNMVIQKFISTIFSDGALTAYNLHGSNTSGRPKIPMKAYSVFYDCFIEAFQSTGLGEHELQAQLTAAIKHSRNRMRQRTFRARKHLEKNLTPMFKSD
ncbi:modifier of mdg4-like isoform X5 [Anopheles stephensi]|uniref:modifier of mdg4-like isoform X5 n=1 Tax=Anopheles stephensi TaxID=30069 RepID=UPI001658A88C|nr:modifier of mdg4-like isoform X5 [Anopheles stephensi]